MFQIPKTNISQIFKGIERIATVGKHFTIGRIHHGPSAGMPQSITSISQKDFKALESFCKSQSPFFFLYSELSSSFKMLSGIDSMMPHMNTILPLA